MGSQVQTYAITRSKKMESTLSHKPSQFDFDWNLSHKPSQFDFDWNLSHKPSDAGVKYMKSPKDEDKQSSFPINFWMPSPLPPAANEDTKETENTQIHDDKEESKTDLNNNSPL